MGRGGGFNGFALRFFFLKIKDVDIWSYSSKLLSSFLSYDPLGIGLLLKEKLGNNRISDFTFISF